MSGPLEISVVIPCYNAARTLPRLLESLAEQTLPRSQYEILVVDDGSTDGCKQQAASSPGVRLIEQQHQGPGAARNLGTQQAQGRLVLYLDSDVVAAKNLLEAHRNRFNAQPGLAASGGSVLPVGSPPLGSWLLVDHLCSWFNAHPRCVYRRPPDYLPSLNFCIDRELVFEKHGLRWEFGLKHTGEDVLFCQAMIGKGLELIFVPEATVQHQDRATMKDYLRHMYRWGEHAPFVRGRFRHLKYSFLFPESPALQALMLPAIVFGYTGLIWKSWLNERPLAASISLPQIFLGRLAYAWGVMRGASLRSRQRVS